MSGPLRPCGRAECRLCNPELDEIADVRHDDLASLLIAGAAFVALLLIAFVFLPVMA